MGKRQHQKDKMYITYSEWSQFYGGKKVESLENEHIKFKQLPYECCCITMAPYENPYCDRDGNVFELEAIIKFVKQFKCNPVTGKPCDLKSLIKLHFHKNHKDEYHCAALFKPFTKTTHIVAIATTGNVFSYKAVEELNIKTKNWRDLLSDEPFERSDIITIQHPSQVEKFNITTFYHIKNNKRVLTAEELAEGKNPQARLKTISNETRDILNQLEKDYVPSSEVVEQKLSADKFNSAHYSTGAVAASFTSTAMAPVLNHEPAIIEEDLVRYARVKKKGYVRITTNLGSLNLELYCDVVPKTCDNFIKHCVSGYYNGTIFHRSIKNFIIQGGDPTGTGTGGASIWNKKFEDEIRPNLSHSGSGVLSMANSGPNTNGSQFFITYRSCRHLDGKHTIFGRLVGGLGVLKTMENMEVNNKDRPIEDIVIEKAFAFVNPFQEADEELANERALEIERIKKEEEDKIKRKEQGMQMKVFRTGVGKYLATPGKSTNPAEPASKLKKKDNQSYQFGNFNNW